jgi:hypothetical protein
MTWRSSLLLAFVFASLGLAGCSGSSDPGQLTPEQEQQMREQMQQVEQEEQARQPEE